MNAKIKKTANFNGAYGAEAVEIIEHTSGPRKGTCSIRGGNYARHAMTADRAQRVIESDRRFTGWQA